MPVTQTEAMLRTFIQASVLLHCNTNRFVSNCKKVAKLCNNILSTQTVLPEDGAIHAETCMIGDNKYMYFIVHAFVGVLKTQLANKILNAAIRKTRKLHRTSLEIPITAQ
jgi:hypothetical protein